MVDPTPHPSRGGGRLLVLTALLGALAATVLGFLTFGAQATAEPNGIPVAVAAPEGGPLRAVAGQVATRGGEAVDWRVTTARQARLLLEDKDVYGVLELRQEERGPSVYVVVSAAVNPAGTQVAQQVLTMTGQAVAERLAQATPDVAAVPVEVETLHQTGTAGRFAPLAISALAWVGGLAAGASLTVLSARSGVLPRRGSRITHVLVTSTLLTGALLGLLALWDSSLDLGLATVGFVFLTALAFAAVQAGLLRLLGLRAMAVLGPLYLLAPAVAGQVPELLDSAYRTLLWSWTPFRFSTEALRSLLLGTPHAPDVAAGAWVLTGLLVAGLLMVLWPTRSAVEEAQPQPPDGVVDVGVDKADRLPGAEGERPAEDGNAGVRR
ncbi:hypothetical protein FHU38_003889 [Saccharomonospora amisosensis]|uniref:Uncharacterized protein n=1 Tax=Saccharomonospora amisosensis TaxID=1128677 RepID=A0A7X5USX8_9PSEU|nr:hypothetical protein [Saccharomonospora amisosensis]